MNDYQLTVAARLRMVRKARKISQEVLAEKSSLSPNTITNAESDKDTSISMTTFLKMAVALEVAPHQLLLPDGEFLDWWHTLSPVRGE